MRRLPWYFVLAVFLLAVGLALDSLSTWLALTSGNAVEGNPLTGFLFQYPLGFPLFIVFKLLGVSLAIYIAWFIRGYARWRRLLYALFLVATASIFIVTSTSNLAIAFGGHGLFPALHSSQ
jgi:hypothetical protein